MKRPTVQFLILIGVLCVLAFLFGCGSKKTGAPKTPVPTDGPTDNPTDIPAESSNMTKGHTHEFTLTRVKATCEGEGYLLHECACGYSFENEIVSSLGHDREKAPVVAPLCEEYGRTAGVVCARCGLVFEGVEPIEPDPLFHDFLHNRCTKCGAETSNGLLSVVTDPETGKMTIVDDGVQLYSVTYIISPEFGDETVTVVGRLTVPMLGNLFLLEGITECGDGMCEGKQSLRSVWLPSTLRIIGSKSFYGCGIKRAALPEGLERIGSEAFAGCRFLYEISLPKTLRSIGDNAFRGIDTVPRFYYAGSEEEFAMIEMSDGMRDYFSGVGVTCGESLSWYCENYS